MSTATAALAPRDMELLAFEREQWTHAGNKEAAVLERFGCSMTLYYQRLQLLIEEPAAVEYDPTLVRHLQQQTERRAARRRRADA